MPYLTKETATEIRKAIKAALPDYRFSIKNRNHSSLDIAIISGPMQLLTNPTKGSESVNHYYIQHHFGARPEVANVLQTISDIAGGQQREETYDGDYGSVPNYYYSISIGKWNKHYQVK